MLHSYLILEMQAFVRTNNAKVHEILKQNDILNQQN